MINNVIEFSLKHSRWVIAISLMLFLAGVNSLFKTPVDAIPDLSDVQVIIKTQYPGQAPQIVEDQVTFPISSAMQRVPKSKVVRGFSYYGDSFVYVIFEDGTDPYWARSRVLEELTQINSNLPQEAKYSLGPDASGIGWVFEYALVDRSFKTDIGELTRLQDWYLKQHLQSIKGVAEIATVGGMEQSFQIVLDVKAMQQLNISLSQVIDSVQQVNRETGGSVVEMAEAEYMVRVKNYPANLKDFEVIPVKHSMPSKGKNTIMQTLAGSTRPVLLQDIATVRIGPYMRRGVTELDGEGEVVGGIVVMRSGENPMRVIEQVKAKLEQLSLGLPEGVEIITTYDRTKIIEDAIDHLRNKILWEMGLIAITCLLFLWHFGSAMVAILVLPFAVLLSILVMNGLGIQANIMSLGGIAIAIGTLIDGSLVMIENMHKKVSQLKGRHSSKNEINYKQIALQACQEVGPGIFFSLLIITVSFLPVFVLGGQEGKLFEPLAYTKSFSMAFGAVLSITLIPVLLSIWVRQSNLQPIKSETDISWLVWLKAKYQLTLNWCLAKPKFILFASGLLMASVWYPWQKLGSEFMPPMNEGDILYMPTTLPGISIGKASELLQHTDRLIKTIPEVDRVFGKIGRANTATDPAPLTMIETTIQLKPKSEWRPGMDIEKIIAELDQTVNVPGLVNSWVPPIKTRIDMLSTGVKTPVGIKMSAASIEELTELGSQIEAILSNLTTTRSVMAERPGLGRFIEIQPKLSKLAEYGLSFKEFNHWIAQGIGGIKVSDAIVGNKRFPISIRLPRNQREDISKIKLLPITNGKGLHIPLEMLADIEIKDGATMIKSENGLLASWVFIEPDLQATSISEYVKQASLKLNQELDLPQGAFYEFGGQYEHLQRVNQSMLEIIPLMALVILLLLLMAFNNVRDVLMILVSVPLSLVGAIWGLYLLDYNLSVAVTVGLIALVGIATEFGVIMLMYLQKSPGETLTDKIIYGATERLRPKIMTVLTILVGLLAVVFGTGVGSEVMTRIAAPILGGMITAPLLSLFLIPVLYQLFHGDQKLGSG